MKITPALLVVWPLNTDYPVFRWNLERFKNYFSSIWIAFSNHGDINLSNFIRSNITFANFIEAVKVDDWRNDAINELLEKVNSEYICFMEQDFLIKDKEFFEKVFKEDHDFIFYQEGIRKHPAFAVVKRKLVDKTHKDFSACPPGDHFYKFFNELPEGINIEELGVKKKEDYYHMGGTSHNYINFQFGDPFYHPINFLFYNYKNLQFPDQHPIFGQIEQQVESTFGHAPIHTFLNKFFPE